MEKSLTQKEVAFEAEIEIMQLSRIERGITNTSLSHIIAIANALEISLPQLFDFDIE